MKVYLVERDLMIKRYPYTDVSVIGVFKSEESAIKCIEEDRGIQGSWTAQYECLELDLED